MNEHQVYEAEIVDKKPGWVLVRIIDCPNMPPPIHDVLWQRPRQCKGSLEVGAKGKAQYRSDHKSGLWYFWEESTQ